MWKSFKQRQPGRTVLRCHNLLRPFAAVDEEQHGHADGDNLLLPGAPHAGFGGPRKLKLELQCDSSSGHRRTLSQALIGAFRTGDLAYRDADGYFWCRGRLKQIITCDGEKISPQHVESALLEHPDVVEAGVVGQPDKIHGEVPVAFVRLRPGAKTSASELREFVRARVEGCGVPQEINFVGALPRGRTGKVDRRQLRERLSSLNVTGRPDRSVADE